MTLQAIRFKTLQDFQTFHQRLIDLNLIDAEQKGELKPLKVRQGNEEVFPFIKQFLRANDGSIYLLEDLKQYLAIATEQELQEAEISFLTQSGESVNLSQLKSQTHLLDQLKRDIDNIQILLLINLGLFNNKQFPSVGSREEINQVKALFDNSKVHNLNGSYHHYLDALSHMESLELNTIVRVCRNFNYMTTMHFDLLKLIWLNENALKQHLIDERGKLNNAGDLDALNACIAEIERNNEQWHSCVQKIFLGLETIQKVIKDSVLKRRQILDTYPEPRTIQEKINEINQEKEDLQVVLGKKKKSATILEWTAMLSLFGALPLGLGVGLVYLLIFIPALTLLGALGIVIGLGVLFFITIATTNITSTALKAIDRRIDRPVQSVEKKLNELEQQILDLQADLQLINDFPQWNRFITQFGDPSALILELEAELSGGIQEPLINSAEIETPKNQNVTPKAQPSTIGMFAYKGSETEALPDPNATAALTIAI